MSIFGNIVSAIFGHGAVATTAAAGSAAVPGVPAAKGTPTVAGPAATGDPMTRQQVEEMIEKVADAQDEEYNWKQSIVDLMKLLKLDSSLSARKQLAQELGYTGALDGSAGNEHLAAQAGHDQACGKWRCGAGQPKARLTAHT